MISITPEAAEQIKISAEQGNTANTPLRIAVSKNDDGSFHYGMGFDDELREDDQKSLSEGINIVVSALSYELLKGTTLDFVELEDGQFNFIFLNPNDPSYTPPPSLTGGEIG
ncbi:MAG: iron-sulfur cluster assembly accessory protein [Gammaproteobacteria bacterium]|nr:iron-sulfur cluster assembly accessory protein [Gammaproteobacteria bacterium]